MFYKLLPPCALLLPLRSSRVDSAGTHRRRWQRPERSLAFYAILLVNVFNLLVTTFYLSSLFRRARKARAPAGLHYLCANELWSTSQIMGSGRRRLNRLANVRWRSVLPVISGKRVTRGSSKCVTGLRLTADFRHNRLRPRASDNGLESRRPRPRGT